MPHLTETPERSPQVLRVPEATRPPAAATLPSSPVTIAPRGGSTHDALGELLLRSVGQRAEASDQLQRQVREQAPAGQLSRFVSTHRTLRVGMSGTDVQVAGIKLNAAIGSELDTALFNEAMRQATVKFQTEKKLGVDGAIGPQTWAALETVTSGRTIDESDVLDVGQKQAAASALMAAGDYAGALKILQGLYANPKISQEFDGIRFNLGSCLHHLGRFDEAARFYQQYLDLPDITGLKRRDALQRLREVTLKQPPGPLESTQAAQTVDPNNRV